MCNSDNSAPLPRAIKISPSTACNLKCLLCPVGTGKVASQASRMSFETFEMVLGKLPGTVSHIKLFNLGEPFLNPDILRMIAAAAAAGFTVDTHTNFSFSRDDGFFTELARSGLAALIVSLDGASQETYSKYRRGGDFELVLDNIKRLIQARRELGLHSPVVVWKFLVNRWNEHEIETARQMASSLGIEFATDLMGLADDLPDCDIGTPLEERMKTWLPMDPQYIKPCYQGTYRRPLFDEPCGELFLRPVVKPDGKVVPCCWVTNKRNAFGDLAEQSFEGIWQNTKYASARELFAEMTCVEPNVRTVCHECSNFAKRQSATLTAGGRSGCGAGSAANAPRKDNE